MQSPSYSFPGPPHPAESIRRDQLKQPAPLRRDCIPFARGGLDSVCEVEKCRIQCPGTALVNLGERFGCWYFCDEHREGAIAWMPYLYPTYEESCR